MTRKALILVDIQNDFCPGGALAVPDGDQVIKPANALAERFKARGYPVVATQDSHPANHQSFASQHPGAHPGDQITLAGIPQVLWPDHCIDGSSGADFNPQLRTDLISKVFKKGTNPQVDSYSGFYDNDKKQATGLADYLSSRAVEEVWICGLATDYCVKATALDAAAEGFAVVVYTPACRAVNLQPADGQSALEELAEAGCELVGITAPETPL